jgi:hypothetical protein
MIILWTIAIVALIVSLGTLALGLFLLYYLLDLYSELYKKLVELGFE